MNALSVPMRVLFPPARMKAVMAGTAMGMGGSYSGKSDGGDQVRLPEKVAELAFADRADQEIASSARALSRRQFWLTEIHRVSC